MKKSSIEWRDTKNGVTSIFEATPFFYDYKYDFNYKYNNYINVFDLILDNVSGVICR